VNTEPTGELRRLRVPIAEGGYDYAVRDALGNLVETGWISPEGERRVDPRIDGANLAAMVPVDQEFT
jgi:hypothetical protein